MKIKVTKAVNNHSVNNDYLALILEWGPDGSIFQSEVVYKDFEFILCFLWRSWRDLKGADA